MQKKALRHILIKDDHSRTLIDRICQSYKLKITIEDNNGKILYGNDSIEDGIEFPLWNDEHQIAMLRSSAPSGEILASLISVLIRKEMEKRKIGAEVLGLYREINMIYDFSEKLSEKIDAESIANMALSEAAQIINYSHGICLLLDSKSGSLVELASSGGSVAQNRDIKKYSQQLKRLIVQGTSAIISSELNDHPALKHLSSVMYAPLKVKQRSIGLLMLGHNDPVEYTAAELKLLTTIALQSASAIESAQLFQKDLREVKDREEAIRKIHEVSTKFVPYEFIRSLGKSKLTEVGLGDQVEREVTVVFADIREFTSFSETLAPEDNFLFINAFNKRMGPVIRSNNGFINQYLGDGFMAIFPDSPQEALRASVEMNRILKIYNPEREKKGRRPIRMGIGMQKGKLIMGITGDIERMDAATISDTVNTAARIEGLSKHYGTSILLTGDCKRGLSNRDEFQFRYLGPVQVKGKKKPIKLYECINGDDDDLYQHKLTTKDMFNDAMKQFFQREFALAALGFQQICKKHPGDKPANLFLNRSASLITQEISDDWEGVENIQFK